MRARAMLFVFVAAVCGRGAVCVGCALSSSFAADAGASDGAAEDSVPDSGTDPDASATVASTTLETSPRLTVLEPPTLHRGQAESVAVVIPPGVNQACPDGRAVFTYGDFMPPRQHVMSAPLKRLLLDESEPVDPADMDAPMPYDSTDGIGAYGSVVDTVCYGDECVAHCGNFVFTHARYKRSDTDMWMVRIPGGRLLYVGIATRYDARDYVFCASPTHCNCAVPPLATFPGALIVEESDDCGRSWKVLSHIDPTDVAGEDYDTFDREAMYYDYFSKRVFITVGAGAQGNKHHDTLVYRSDDDGKTWNAKTPYVLKGVFPPNNMTSTRSGLYIARCKATGYPELDFSPHADTKVFHTFSVPYEEQPAPVHGSGTNPQPPIRVPCGNADADDVLGHFRLVFPGVTLARGPNLHSVGVALDAIRVAYPSIETVTVPLLGTIERSVLRVVEAFIPVDTPNAKPVVQPLATIRAKEADASTIQARFIETDRGFEFTPPPRSSNEGWLENAAVLYWLEVPSAKNFVGAWFGAGETARWAAFADFNMVYGPAQLAWDNGAPASWTPNYGPWAGDYQAGAFFHLNLGGPRDVLFFLAQWPQSDQAPPAAPNANLHYNILTLSRPP